MFWTSMARKRSLLWSSHHFYWHHFRQYQKANSSTDIHQSFWLHPNFQKQHSKMRHISPNTSNLQKIWIRTLWITIIISNVFGHKNLKIKNQVLKIKIQIHIYYLPKLLWSLSRLLWSCVSASIWPKFRLVRLG